MLKFLLYALLIGIVTGGCKNQEQMRGQDKHPTTHTESSPSIDGKWFILQIDDESVDGTEAFLEFNTSENRFWGNAGCNSFNSSIQKEDEHLHFGQIVATKMFCPEIKLEDQLLRLLNDSEWQLTREADRLTLKNAMHTIILRKEN